MYKFYTAMIIVIMLLTLTGSGHAAAQEQVGADCTNPPNLVPFADLRNCDLNGRNMEGVDLSNADLSGANLDNASLFTSNLVSATFDNASLRNTNLEDGFAPGGSFINADFSGANLYFAFFRGGNLSGANFSNHYLSSVDFESAILQNAVFAGSTLSGVDMRNSDLRGADLSFTTLWYVSLNNADLRNANLLGAKRRNGTHLTGATWGNTTCSDGSNSDDNDGDNFTCESNFLVNQPPTVSLTSPGNNTTVNRNVNVTVSATASDPDGQVDRVEFFANGGRIGSDSSVPYSMVWRSTVRGTFTITARAYDFDGGVTTSAPVTVRVK
jgi:uncharacterized protein YjbI with pentapeptide repeats